MFVHYDSATKEISFWMDRQGWEVGKSPMVEIPSEEFTAMLAIAETNFKICPKCKNRSISRYIQALRTDASYSDTKKGLPADYPKFVPTYILLACNCGLYLIRVKIAGRTRCFRPPDKTKAPNPPWVRSMDDPFDTPQASATMNELRQTLTSTAIFGSGTARTSRVTANAQIFTPTPFPWDRPDEPEPETR